MPRRKRVERLTSGHVISIFFVSQHSTLTNIMSPRAIAPICWRLKSFCLLLWLTWIQCASQNNLANPFVEKLSENFVRLITGLASWGHNSALLMSCAATNGFRYRLMSPDFNRDCDVCGKVIEWGARLTKNLKRKIGTRSCVFVCARALGTQECLWRRQMRPNLHKNLLTSNPSVTHYPLSLSWQNTFWLMPRMLDDSESRCARLTCWT